MNEVSLNSKEAMQHAMAFLKPFLKDMPGETRRMLVEAWRNQFEALPEVQEDRRKTGEFFCAMKSVGRVKPAAESAPKTEAPAEDPSGKAPESSKEDDLKVADISTLSPKSLRLVYICSPFRADTKVERRTYRDYAKGLAFFACTQGKLPVVPHLMYPAFLHDDDVDEHCYGMLCALELLTRCDEVWVAEDFGISRGMEYELKTAKKLGIPIRFFSRADEGGKE